MDRAWFALLVPLLVGGCATQWTKPGTTQQQFEYDKAACTAEAYARLPPAMQAFPIGGGYTTPMYTSCTGGYYAANCVTTGGTYIPPTVVPIDMNTGARNAAFDACMYGRGYSQVSQSAGTSVAASGVVGGYGTPQLGNEGKPVKKIDQCAWNKVTATEAVALNKQYTIQVVPKDRCP